MSRLLIALLSILLYSTTLKAQEINAENKAGQTIRSEIGDKSLNLSSDSNNIDTVPTPDVFPEAGYNVYKYLVDNLEVPLSVSRKSKKRRTTLEFIIDKDGFVTHVTIEQSSGDESFDKAAKDVVERLPRFKSPAMLNGKPVNLYYLLPIQYN